MYFGVILDPHYLLELVTWNFAAMYKCDPLKVVWFVDAINKKLPKMFHQYKAAHDEQHKHEQPHVGAIEFASQSEMSYIAKFLEYLEMADAFKQHLRDKNSIDRKNELERY